MAQNKYELPPFSSNHQGILALCIGILLLLYTLGFTPLVMHYFVAFLALGLIIFGGVLLRLDEKVRALISRVR